MHTIKKTGVAMALCLSTFFATAQVENNFTINGHFRDTAGAPEKVYLYFNRGQVDERIDSSDVINGYYRFTGYIDFITFAQLQADRHNGFGFGELQVVIDKGVFNIESAGDLFKPKTHRSYTATGSGSLADNEHQEISRPMMAFGDSIRKMKDAPEYRDDMKKLASFVAQTYHEDIITHAFVLNYNAGLEYIKNHPRSSVAPLMLAELFDYPYPKLPSGTFDSLMSGLPATAQAETKKIIAHTYADKQAQAKAKELEADKTAIGAKAPDFTQNDVNGNAVRLSALKGKYILLDFWASWCGPCRAENPNVVEAYKTYKDKGFTILGVSLDDVSTKNAWLAAIKKDGLAWTEVSDLGGWQNEVAKLYDVKAIPQNLLIGPDGVIIAKNLRGDALQQKLAGLFDHTQHIAQ